jgi:hypothetical protein
MSLDIPEAWYQGLPENRRNLIDQIRIDREEIKCLKKGWYDFESIGEEFDSDYVDKISGMLIETIRCGFPFTCRLRPKVDSILLFKWFGFYGYHSTLEIPRTKPIRAYNSVVEEVRWRMTGDSLDEEYFSWLLQRLEWKTAEYELKNTQRTKR